MINLVGLELQQAQKELLARTGREADVEYIAPPRGTPYGKGLWRVVRACPERGCITAAFFPCPLVAEQADGGSAQTPVNQ